MPRVHRRQQVCLACNLHVHLYLYQRPSPSKTASIALHIIKQEIFMNLIFAFSSVMKVCKNIFCIPHNKTICVHFLDKLKMRENTKIRQTQRIPVLQ